MVERQWARRSVVAEVLTGGKWKSNKPNNKPNFGRYAQGKERTMPPRKEIACHFPRSLVLDQRTWHHLAQALEVTTSQQRRDKLQALVAHLPLVNRTVIITCRRICAGGVRMTVSPKWNDVCPPACEHATPISRRPTSSFVAAIAPHAHTQRRSMQLSGARLS
jgi:hypothetical protein